MYFWCPWSVFVVFSGAKIIILFSVFIFWTVAEMPVYFFLGIWFLIQFLNGFFTLPGSRQGLVKVAWWAYIGGFTGGFVFASFLRNRKR